MAKPNATKQKKKTKKSNQPNNYCTSSLPLSAAPLTLKPPGTEPATARCLPTVHIYLVDNASTQNANGRYTKSANIKQQEKQKKTRMSCAFLICVPPPPLLCPFLCKRECKREGKIAFLNHSRRRNYPHQHTFSPHPPKKKPQYYSNKKPRTSFFCRPEKNGK